jgi:cob(I)alamin adenosyltransferase
VVNANGAGASEELSDAARAAKREQKAGHRRGRSNKGLVLVITGNGKGKTTSALGMVMRAWGRGMKVAMFQFIKAKTANWGETRAARKMGVDLTALGGGFTWVSADIEHDRALAREGWERCRVALEDPAVEIVVLDEMTYCFTYGWLDLEEVLDALRRRPDGQHVIITGRDAPQALIDFADTVSEIQVVKHAHKAGIKAQKGIEF